MPYSSETQKIRARVLKYVEGKRGLDLGCGHDKITPEAIGVNLNFGGQGDKAEFWFNCNEPLPCADGMWDFVYSSHLLEHLAPPPEQVLSDWCRVLKPGGFLVLYIPHKEMYLEDNPEHLRMWTTEELLAVVERVDGLITVEHHTDDVTKDPELYSFMIVAKKAQ